MSSNNDGWNMVPIKNKRRRKNRGRNNKKKLINTNTIPKQLSFIINENKQYIDIKQNNIHQYKQLIESEMKKIDTIKQHIHKLQIIQNIVQPILSEFKTLTNTLKHSEMNIEYVCYGLCNLLLANQMQE
jgi:hypothetical protein